MKIIAIANQKGGVAKTTTTINLGSCLAALGKKILIIDMDPQANSTKGIGFDEVAIGKTTIYDCLCNDIPISAALFPTVINRLAIVPASIRLANAELELTAIVGRESILKDLIEHANLDFDFVLIDCNPSLGLLTVNSLSAAEGVLIPMEANIFSFEGIEQLVKVIQLIKRKINHRLEIFGVLLTRADSRTNISKEFELQLHDIFQEKAFRTVIHQNVDISKAQSERMPINIFAPKSTGALEYMELAKEVIENG